MKRFIFKTLIFSAITSIALVLYVYYASFVLEKLNGPNTQKQIEQSFKNAIEKEYDLIVLGNSRLYRGINPDKFSKSAYNFSHDNDSYNQLYYKLQLLLEEGKSIETLILGIDYFQFSFLSDSRNYVYAPLLGEEYMNDFESYPPPWESLKNYWGLSKFSTILLATTKLLKSGKTLSPKAHIKDNGQYIKRGKASPRDLVRRESNKLDVQANYFDKLLDLCSEKEITVFLVMLPMRENELKSYDEEIIMNYNLYFQKKADAYPNTFLLNHCCTGDFKIEDFTDITHLNEKAADRYTIFLDDEIKKTLLQEQ